MNSHLLFVSLLTALSLTTAPSLRALTLCVHSLCPGFLPVWHILIIQVWAKSPITREVFPDHLIQTLPHPGVSLSHLSPSFLLFLTLVTLSTIILYICLLVYCVFSSDFPAGRAVSASNPYAVILNWTCVCQKNWRSPESVPALLLPGSSLPWTIIIAPLGFWQRGEQCIDLPGHMGCKQIRTLFPTFPFHFLCWAGSSLALTEYLLCPQIYNSFQILHESPVLCFQVISRWNFSPLFQLRLPVRE